MSGVETVGRLKSDPIPLSGLPTQPAPRNIAVDAYRGFVMLLMMGEVLELARIARSYPGNLFWQIAGFNQTHTEWAGVSLHDMIQPSFSLLVGVALPYSIASRVKKGQPFSKMLLHTVLRSLILIALGIFLRSTRSTQTYFTFEDTLTQIGLGYTFLFLLGFRSERVQWTALGFILFGYWLAWALYPAPGPGFNWAAVGVPPDWHYNFSGFAAHWNKNSNLGNAIDQWFLNLFPRTQPFVFNGGGYLTSSFIPTLGTMILGLIAGRWLRAAAPAIPFKKLLVTGAALIAAAVLLHVTGICPIVKRIWTPAWTLFSGGIAFYFLAAFSWLIDVRGHRKLAFPLVVIGRNSIVAYCLAGLCESFIVQSLHIHLGRAPFELFGQSLEPLLLGITVLLLYWVILFWMYRRNIFIRI
jgi:heparan-alpha-glucosaminide N-acetyltransferase